MHFVSAGICVSAGRCPKCLHDVLKLYLIEFLSRPTGGNNAGCFKAAISRLRSERVEQN